MSMSQVDPDDTVHPDPDLEHEVRQVAGQQGGDSLDTVTQKHFVGSKRIAGVFDEQDLEVAAQVLDVLLSIFTILLEDWMNVRGRNTPDNVTKITCKID